MAKIPPFLLLVALLFPELARAEDAQVTDLPGKVELNFQSSRASDLLSIYQELIQEKLILDSGIEMGPLLTLESRGAISREKAIELIESTLMLNGYTLLQQGPGAIKVLGPAKFARSEGTPVYYSLGELPKGERVVSYFMNLKNISPTEAVIIFVSKVNPPKAYSSFVVVPNANAVLITESTTVVRQLVAMQPSFDVPSEAKGSEKEP